MAIDWEEIIAKSIVYRPAGMGHVSVRRDLTYKTVDGLPLRMDVYYPRTFRDGARLPAVIFIHGDAPLTLSKQPKEWGQYLGWGQLAAASGLVGITFNHRSSERLTKIEAPASDVDDLVRYVRTNARALGVDENRLCLWAASAGVPYGARAALRGAPGYVRAIVVYYGLMDLVFLRERIPPEISDDTLREYSALHHLIQQSGRIAPTFIAKAGLDRPGLNASIDRFVEEAGKLGAHVQLAYQPQGHHGFDVEDDDDASREIIWKTLDFIKTHLDV
jgi:acetyl esterase/lipase